MSNPLIAARDAFVTRNPARVFSREGRNWDVLEAGTGPVLLLLPGTLGQGDVFWQQIDALSDRLRIVALSYPETGTLEAWAADILALINDMALLKVSLLGTSLGGYLAQYIAATHPTRIARLIAANTLVDTTPVQTARPYVLDLHNESIAVLRAGFTDGLSAWAEADPTVGNVVDLLLQEVNGRISEAGLRARLSALKQAPALPPPALPADMITSIESDDDPLIPAAMRAQTRTALQPAVAYRFRHGGHFPYLTQAPAYTALLEQVMGLEKTGGIWGKSAERVL